MDNHLLLFYQKQKIRVADSEIKRKKRIRYLSLFRICSFLMLLFSLVYLTRFGIWTGLLPGVVFIGVFLILVKKHSFFQYEKRKADVLSGLIANELQALEHRFSQFDNGKEFIHPRHAYSHDLDLFGEGSLFQFLNRTSTIRGKIKLSEWIQKPLLTKEKIEARQSAVREIATKRAWRLEFRTIGNLFDETIEQHHEIVNWAGEELPFRNRKITGILYLVLPILTVLLFIPAIAAGIKIPLYILIGLQWSLLFFFRRKVKSYFRVFERKAGLIEKYQTLLRIIEKESFTSSEMISLKKQVMDPESATLIISKLGRLVREFEFRQNMIAGFLLNSLFLWDIRCIYRLHKWHRENSHKLFGWLGTLEETDALISLANYADNHPQYVFPEIVSGFFVLKTTKLGHPLLHPAKRICNDFSIEGWHKAVIVTGANMAGKSTFLRTVGVTIVLAGLGAPVCASECLIKPVELYTNMRTTDSLFKDESYFYAELKRLQEILTRLENGKELFIILDEMLKGTNSVDKLNGSRTLIRKLTNFKSVSLIATHDLKLSEMENELPGKVINQCFEIQILNNELFFDYKLSNGVTQTMNATFLMKKMGII
jgi:hypothetical protein